MKILVVHHVETGKYYTCTVDELLRVIEETWSTMSYALRQQTKPSFKLWVVARENRNDLGPVLGEFNLHELSTLESTF